MRPVRVEVADAVNDSHFPLIPEVFYLRHVGVEAHVVVDAEHLVGRDADHRTGIIVQAIGVGDNGVQVIIAACELYR